jgi:hypothetical protein
VPRDKLFLLLANPGSYTEVEIPHTDRPAYDLRAIGYLTVCEAIKLPMATINL